MTNQCEAPNLKFGTPGSCDQPASETITHVHGNSARYCAEHARIAKIYHAENPDWLLEAL